MNFTKLNELTSLELNISDKISSDNLIPSAITATNEISHGYYGLSVMMITFIIITIIAFKQDGDIRLDIMRSMMFGSGFSFILGMIMLVTGFTTSLVHVIWFLIIFATLFFIILGIKKKGQ